MENIIEVKERDSYAIIEITVRGKLVRLEVSDKEDSICITTVDGSMDIRPKTSNQVLLSTLV